MKKLFVLAMVVVLSLSLAWAADSIKNTNQAVKATKALSAPQTVDDASNRPARQAQSQEAVTAPEPEAAQAPAPYRVITRDVPSEYRGLGENVDKEAAYLEEKEKAEAEFLAKQPSVPPSEPPVITETSLFFEDFDGVAGWSPSNPPTGWTITTEDGGGWWDNYDWARYASTTWGVAFARNYSASSARYCDDWMISPSVNFSTATACSLNFRFYYDAPTSGFYRQKGEILLSDDGGMTWAYAVRTFTGSSADSGTLSSPLIRRVDISSFAAGKASVIVGFHFYKDSLFTGNYFGFDNVEFTADGVSLGSQSFDETGWGWQSGNTSWLGPVNEWSGWTAIDLDEYTMPWNNNDWHAWYSTGFADTVADAYYIPDDWSRDKMISPSVNCASSPYVHLRFKTFYDDGSAVDDSGFVLGTADNWVTTQVIATYAGVDYGASSTPALPDYDISSWAGNQAAVQVAFQWIRGGGTASRSWVFDNVELYVPNADDIRANGIPVPSGTIFTGANYGVIGTLENVGTAQQTFDATIVLNDGITDVYNQTVTGITLNSGQVMDVAFPAFSPASAGSYTKTLTVVNAGDENTANDVYTGSFNVLALATVPLNYFTNLEPDNGSCTMGAGEWEWGIPTYASGPSAAYSGVNVWGTDLDNTYDASVLNTLYLPRVTLTGGTNFQFSFYMWHAFEGTTFDSRFDGANLKISTDEGISWNLLWCSLPYDTTISPTTNPLVGQFVWTSDRQTWNNITADLSPYAGQTIVMRFDMAGDASVHDAGLYLDDLGITLILDDVGITSIDEPLPGIKFVGSSYDFKATAQNFMLTPATFDVEFYAGPTLLGTVFGVTLAGGASQQVTCPVQWTPLSAGPHTLTAMTVLGTDSNPGNDQVSVLYPVLGAIVTLPFFTDFEANNGDFAGMTEWEWGTPTLVGPSSAYSGVNCWGTDLDDDYDILTHNVLYSAPVNLGAAANPILRFYMWHDVETNWDGCNVKISGDLGGTWNVLTTNIPYDDIGDLGVPGLEGEPIWEGFRPWTQVEASLAAYVGQTVIVRFDQSSDGSITYPGFYIDDFRVFEPMDDVGITSIDQPGMLTVSGSLNVVATAQNFSSAPATFDVNFYVDAILLGTATGVNLGGNSSAQVTCPTQWVVSTEGDYVISATTVLPGDTNPGNDTASKTSTVRNAVVLPLSEGFDVSGIPTNWTILNLGGPATQWGPSTTLFRSAPNSAAMLYDASADQDDWLVLPPLDLSTVAGAKFTFYEDQQYWTSYGDHHYIMIGTGPSFDPLTAAVLVDWTPLDHTIEGFAGAPVNLDLTAYVGQNVWLALRYTGIDADNWFVDDVSASELVVDMAAVEIGVPTDVFFALGRVGVAGQYRGTIAEIGGVGATVDATFNVYDPSMALVFTSTVLGTVIPAGGSAEITFPDLFTPVSNGTFTLELVATAAGDVDPLNNTFTRSMAVSGTHLAQYYDPNDGPYQYTSADRQGRKFAEVFTPIANGFLTSANHYIGAPTTGGTLVFAVWPMVGGVPDTLNPLYVGDPITIPPGGWIYSVDYPTPIPVTAGVDIAIGHMNVWGAFNDLTAFFELGDDGLGRDLWDRAIGAGFVLHGYGDWWTEAVLMYPNPLNPEVAVSPSSFSEVVAVDQTLNVLMTIQNVGGVGTPDLNWSAASADAWIQNITPAAGTIPGLGSQDVTFDINTAGLTPYTLYSGGITITSNDPIGPFFVPVEVYTAPTPAVGLAQSGNFANIGVSNHGVLGDQDLQGNTYNWGGTINVNYGGTFILGNSESTMLLEYGVGIDNNPYRATSNLNMADPFNPQASFDGNTVLAGLGVDYTGYGFPGPDTGDFFFHEYILTNNSALAAPITGIFIGLYFDWDIGSTDLITFDRAHNLIIQGPTGGPYYGIMLLTDNVNTLMGVSQDSFIYDQSGWNAATLYALMNSNADIQPHTYADMGSMLSFGPFDLADGAKDTIAFAIIGGSSIANVQSRAELALDVWIGVPPGCVYIKGDINNVPPANGIDVTYGVSYLKGGPVPPVRCDNCPQPAPFYAAMDVNGTCNTNGIDITYFVSYLKGGPPLLFCPTCPPAPPVSAMMPKLDAKSTNVGNAGQ